MNLSLTPIILRIKVFLIPQDVYSGWSLDAKFFGNGEIRLRRYEQ
jgi:hypothetical protein